MTNAEVRASECKRVEAIQKAGIEWVEVLGCNHPPDECDAYRAIQGKLFRIEDAPKLPLPGCDKAHCKCIILASEGPEPSEELIEDLSVSMPAGCEAPRDSGRPGVKLSELRYGKSHMANVRVQEPGWLKWLVIGLLVFLLAPVVVWMVWSWLTSLVR